MCLANESVPRGNLTSVSRQNYSDGILSLTRKMSSISRDYQAPFY